jgi:hypothetical protein
MPKRKDRRSGNGFGKPQLSPDWYQGWSVGIAEMCKSINAEIAYINPEAPFVAFLLHETKEIKCFGDPDLVRGFKTIAYEKFEMTPEEFEFTGD